MRSARIEECIECGSVERTCPTGQCRPHDAGPEPSCEGDGVSPDPPDGIVGVQLAVIVAAMPRMKWFTTPLALVLSMLQNIT